MAALAGVPVWAWLLWVVLVFVAALLFAPRSRRAHPLGRRRWWRIAGQLLLGAALVLVRADTALAATLLAALGGALYGNSSGARPSDAEGG